MNQDARYESANRLAEREILRSQWSKEYEGKTKAELQTILADLRGRKNSWEEQSAESPGHQDQEDYVLLREQVRFLEELIRAFVPGI